MQENEPFSPEAGEGRSRSRGGRPGVAGYGDGRARRGGPERRARALRRAQGRRGCGGRGDGGGHAGRQARGAVCEGATARTTGEDATACARAGARRRRARGVTATAGEDGRRRESRRGRVTARRLRVANFGPDSGSRCLQAEIWEARWSWALIRVLKFCMPTSKWRNRGLILGLRLEML